MDKLTKNKKLIIVFILIALTIGLVLICLNKISSRGDDWQMKISDVSKDCYSNTLSIYPNKDYAVLSATGNRVIASGRSTYTNTIDYLRDKIKRYPMDEDKFINYNVKFNNGASMTIDQERSPELEEFLKTIKVDNLFWCN